MIILIQIFVIEGITRLAYFGLSQKKVEENNNDDQNKNKKD